MADDKKGHHMLHATYPIYIYTYIHIYLYFIEPYINIHTKMSCAYGSPRDHRWIIWLASGLMPQTFQGMCGTPPHSKPGRIQPDVHEAESQLEVWEYQNLINAQPKFFLFDVWWLLFWPVAMDPNGFSNKKWHPRNRATMKRRTTWVSLSKSHLRSQLFHMKQLLISTCDGSSVSVRPHEEIRS